MTPAPAVTEQPKDKAWHSQSAEEAPARLASTAEGLSSHEAAQRLATDGLNELKEGKPTSPLQIVLGQFKSLIIWILIAAGVISGLMGERVDAIAILAIVVLNAVIGFYQEFRAEKSITALKKTDRASSQGATRRASHFNSSLGNRHAWQQRKTEQIFKGQSKERWRPENENMEAWERGNVRGVIANES